MEQNAIEQRSLEGSFDADAMEGWEMMSYDTSVMSQLDKKFAGGSTPTSWYVGGTIGVAVIAVATYFIVSSGDNPKEPVQKTPIAQTEEQQEITFEETDLILPAEIEQMQEVPKNAQLPAADIKEEFTEIKEFHISEPPIPFVELPILDIDLNDKKDLEIIKAHEAAKEIYLHDMKLVDYRNYRSKPQIKIKHIVLTGTPANMEDEESEENEAVWRDVDVPYIDYIDKSMKIFERGNYKRALSRFETILETYSTDVNANFYSGICLYNLGEYESAKERFDACINGPYSNFDEEAEWMMAESYTKLGNKTAARTLYKKISEGGGYYAKQAGKKL